MSHHFSGPNLGFPNGDPRLDLTDLYAFPKPGDGRKSILVMNVHPSIGWDRQLTRPDPFSSTALYEFRIDTDGDAVADVTYQLRFSPFESGAQTATLYRLQAAEVGRAPELIIDAAPVSSGSEARVTEEGDYRLFAGWRSDPFFFDPIGFSNDFRFTGVDFFADKDVCSIVLEAPNSVFGPTGAGVWGRILDGSSGGWVQVERGGLAAQSIFLTGEAQQAYLAAEPADDAQFIPVFAHALEHAGGYSVDEAQRVARTLLPDVLRFNPSQPASYPSNGRTLTDDALDHFIALFTNGKVKTEGLKAHADLLAGFPYLGPPTLGSANS
jgi:Domain of unknown function (DUF4331)